MKPRSIRLRLWSAAVVSILLGLIVAGLGLSFLFERHVQRRIESELAVQLNQLIAAARFSGNTLTVEPQLTDPRFQLPLSGNYWQVEDLATGTLVRSRSLWDATLAAPTGDAIDGSLHLHEIEGPANARLIAVERTITDADGSAFRVIVGEDHATLTRATTDYLGELVPALLLLAAILITANFAQISIGLAPLENLRRSVREVIGRRNKRLQGPAPSEVQPLADEINRLLEAQEKALERARSRAADLAHGLKTPLQVLSSDIRSLRARGENQLADGIEKSASAIRRHIERELARSRLAPGTTAPYGANLAEVAAQVVSVVRRAPSAENLIFDLAVAQDLVAPMEEGDLTEVLGNLIENAARFARSKVGIDADAKPEGMAIFVSDDGPGIPAADRKAALTRGLRLEQTGDGVGLGLAIVADIVAAYGGTITLDEAAPGLKVSLFIPARQ